jgi:hypothetical protein
MYSVLDLSVSPSGKGASNDPIYRDLDLNLKDFWDKVYSENFLNWQGDKSKSGRGSEGEDAVTKINIVDMLIAEFKLSTIIDIGCGDFYWASNLENMSSLDKYIAIDVSKYIIAENKKNNKINNVEFINANMSNEDENSKFSNEEIDLCIMFDVLGHCLQEEIDSIVKFLVNSKIKNLLINQLDKDASLWDGKNKNVRNLPVNIEKHADFKFIHKFRINSIDLYRLR